MTLSGESRKGAGAAVAVVLVLVAAGGLSVRAHRPPNPLPENAPATEFSAIRAVGHLERYATAPHRAGTDANYRVRDYIIETLRSMGGTPELHAPTTVPEKKDDFRANLLDRFMRREESGRNASIVANPQNVMVRLPGTANTKALLFMGHYDSVPFGPGASDDGAGVATMLETYRALKAGPPLENDVVFLFTDGEECGLWGPRAFLQHPWANDVGLVMNFEARGVYGPSYLFETSDDNGWLVAEAAKCMPYPMMSSLMFDGYNHTPFETDYDVLKHRYPGLNVAWVGNVGYYHTPNDNTTNISRASLQHHGSYAMAFARHFGNMPLTEIPKKPNAVYFNPYGTMLIHYPGWAAGPLAAAVALLFANVVALGFARKRLTVRGLLWGLLMFFAVLIAVMAGSAIAFGLEFAVHRMFIVHCTTYYLWADIGFGIAVAAALHRFFRKRASVDDLAVGILLWWGLRLLYTGFWSPASSFLFAWPLAFTLVGLGISFLLPADKPGAPRRVAALVLSALPGIALLCPLFYLGDLMLSALAGPLVMIVFVLQYSLLVPHADLALAGRTRGVARLGLAMGLVFLAFGLALNGASPAQPRTDSVTYCLDADSGQAAWVSTDPKPDEWTAQFFPGKPGRGGIPEFGYGRLEFMKSPAPVLPLPAPEAQVLSDTTGANGRRVKLHIAAKRPAARVSVEFTCEGGLSDIVVNDKPLGRQPSPWWLDYEILPREGFDISLRVAAGKELRLNLVDYAFELPKLPDKPIPPRPDSLINEPNTMNFDAEFQSDETLVRKSIVLAPR